MDLAKLVKKHHNCAFVHAHAYSVKEDIGARSSGQHEIRGSKFLTPVGNE